MKIKNIEQEVLDRVRLEKIFLLAKEVFEGPKFAVEGVISSSFSVYRISSGEHSGREPRELVVNFSISPRYPAGRMEVYSNEAKKKAVDFGWRYEERGLNKQLGESSFSDFFRKPQIEIEYVEKSPILKR